MRPLQRVCVGQGVAGEGTFTASRGLSFWHEAFAAEVSPSQRLSLEWPDSPDAKERACKER